MPKNASFQPCQSAKTLTTQRVKRLGPSNAHAEVTFILPQAAGESLLREIRKVPVGNSSLPEMRALTHGFGITKELQVLTLASTLVGSNLGIFTLVFAESHVAIT